MSRSEEFPGTVPTDFMSDSTFLQTFLPTLRCLIEGIGMGGWGGGGGGRKMIQNVINGGLGV